MAYFIKPLKVTVFCAVVVGVTFMTKTIATQLSTQSVTQTATTKLRVATFNVSMEALNYIKRSPNSSPNVSGNELTQALKQNNQQIKNIAEIIQRVNPDIILLNEFDRVNNQHENIRYFIKNYLAKAQNDQTAINYPYFYQGPVNTGVKVNNMNNDKSITHGFGYFEGHFGMVLLSKYPIDYNTIKTFQFFKWRDMPNALKPISPETNQPWYSDSIWNELRLSSKSHWDIPININGKEIHILASHPTPPVFDGPENRNGNRNHDEIRFWRDYIDNTQANYIYDDGGKKGGLSPNKPFVILGDQNASSVEGDAINSGIKSLLTNNKLQDPMPTSIGGELYRTDNNNAKYHTAYWGMRADYVLPSALDFTIKNSGVFWPQKKDETYRLIKDRAASSDHRLVWVDLELTL
jgi:endonuclease/exonuclease/phosphatase family metal-dependent hydrolase